MRRIAPLCLLAVAALQGEDYVLGPDSQPQPNVPKGAVTKLSWTSSIYPGSTRDYWIYVPTQYKPDKPACVMIFQDGGGMVSETGAFRAPIVLDNLIHRGEMPVTIGIFINPGVTNALTPATQQNRYNRSFEYDALGDRYARFLIEELLPEVGKNYRLSKDPNDYALAGSSSGGIAAFNAAWVRPDKFRRVVSFVGSYTNLRGADTLSGLIRKTEPKPLRVFLQDGNRDQDIYSGNWFLANQELYSSLQYAGYDSTFVVGTEGHNGKHGGAILPYALRWVWRDYPRPIAKPVKMNERGLYAILDPDKDWELLGSDYQLTADSAVDPQGIVYFTDHRNDRINRIDREGKVTVWKQGAGGAHGLALGPDGRLYAGQHDRKRIVSFSPDGKETVVLEGVQTHHFTVSAAGNLYFAQAPLHQLSMLNPKGVSRVVLDTLKWPKVARVSPDQAWLAVDDPNTRWIWSFQIAADGSLTNGQPFYHLETLDESSATDASGMAFDSEGFLYVATALGIQVCDPAGRVNAVLALPSGGAASDVFFAGPNLQWLYATDGSRLYRRLVKRHGVAAPLKPPQPRL